MAVEQMLSRIISRALERNNDSLKNKALRPIRDCILGMKMNLCFGAKL
jgi:hypothetical protein